MNVADRDWSAFEGEPVTQTCVCPCDTEYRSHAKFFIGPDGTMKGGGNFSKDPCPSCGSHEPRSTHSDPESWTL